MHLATFKPLDSIRMIKQRDWQRICVYLGSNRKIKREKGFLKLLNAFLISFILITRFYVVIFSTFGSNTYLLASHVDMSVFVASKTSYELKLGSSLHVTLTILKSDLMTRCDILKTKQDLQEKRKKPSLGCFHYDCCELFYDYLSLLPVQASLNTGFWSLIFPNIFYL